MDEDSFIAHELRPLARACAHFDPRHLTDDIAILSAGGDVSFVVSKDVLVEGTHFVSGAPAGVALRRALRVNISDVVAKGAVPKAYMLGVVFPPGRSPEDVATLSAAARKEQERWGMTLLGGDTVVGGSHLTLSVTVFGTLAADISPPGRNGARPGDGIYVTGVVGEAALGLIAAQAPKRLLRLDREHVGFVLNRYWLPEPRAAFGKRLPGLASASCDISDGLLLDLSRIAGVSGVSAVLHSEVVPFSPAVRSAVSGGMFSYEAAVTGGDDYEILFCAPLSAEAALLDRAPCRVTRIGIIEEGEGLRFTGEHATTFERAFQQGGGYRHLLTS